MQEAEPADCRRLPPRRGCHYSEVRVWRGGRLVPLVVGARLWKSHVNKHHGVDVVICLLKRACPRPDEAAVAAAEKPL